MMERAAEPARSRIELASLALASIRSLFINTKSIWSVVPVWCYIFHRHPGSCHRGRLCVGCTAAKCIFKFHLQTQSQISACSSAIEYCCVGTVSIRIEKQKPDDVKQHHRDGCMMAVWYLREWWINSTINMSLMLKKGSNRWDFFNLCCSLLKDVACINRQMNHIDLKTL